MPKVIEVIYENGVFKPLEKVDLNEGEKLRIEIREKVSEKTRGVIKGCDIDSILEEIESGGIL
ncbi:antitoxin family protein [Archaeoglobus neptunius]|uniref:antitoxin family protein n=1 Tax=Archaeoglobus neptunius TaxID=2798580 RepID=UPI001925FEC5|nr:antitoxin family protein [Archaeoglobus neptunius]